MRRHARGFREKYYLRQHSNNLSCSSNSSKEIIFLHRLTLLNIFIICGFALSRWQHFQANQNLNVLQAKAPTSQTDTLHTKLHKMLFLIWKSHIWKSNAEIKFYCSVKETVSQKQEVWQLFDLNATVQRSSHIRLAVWKNILRLKTLWRFIICFSLELVKNGAHKMRDH